MVRVRNAFFHDHIAPEWPDGYGDVFVLDPPLTLPPWTWARTVRRAANVLARARYTASLWVRMPPEEVTGAWIRRAWRRFLRYIPVPLALAESEPAPEDFSFPPRRVREPLPAGAATFGASLPESEARALEVLVRLGRGYTAEIASQALLSIHATREALYRLRRKGLALRIDENGRPFWVPRRKGVSLALRRWGVPKGVSFRFRRERRSRASARHVRTARLWNAWLRKAGYSVFGGWSEAVIPGLGRAAPDALAWGLWQGQETLFWCEVEAGHASIEALARKYERRLAAAEAFATEWGMPLVFVVLGPPWAVRASALRLRPRQAAVCLAAWRDFGRLPGPVPGRITRWHTVQM